MSNVTVIVTDPIPGAKCSCIASGNDCSRPEIAKYSCEISQKNPVVSEVTNTVHKVVGITSYSTIILGFIIFPIFVLIGIARLIFFLKKSDRLKTTFRIGSIFFLIVMIFYFGSFWLNIIAPWIFR